MGGRITRLSPEGVARLLAPATDSGLFVKSGDIRPAPGYAAGFVTYTIDLRRGEQIVHRSTTNSRTEANLAEAERIIALAEHLDALESWLPAEAWATGPASAVPYISSQFLLKLTVFKDRPGAVYPPLPLDMADVDWPLDGRLEDFGKALAKPPLGAGTASRCGVITLAQAIAVQRALTVPNVPTSLATQVDLDWAAARSQITVSVSPLLPDDPRDCAVDRSWP